VNDPYGAESDKWDNLIRSPPEDMIENTESFGTYRLTIYSALFNVD
jgi:hypothetical protein